MTIRNGSAFTPYGWLVCGWVIVTAFQYGYHISVLNQIQAVLTCKATHPTATAPLPACFPISDVTFSFVTAIFTVGGLLGSLVANRIMDKSGRRGAHRLCAVLVAVGNAAMGFAYNIPMLLIGRLLVGAGSGIGLCVGPIFLSEIAPTKISGSVGVLTQLAIVIGIMFTQVVGINFATPALWRWVFAISFGIAVLQFFSASFVIESPAFLWRAKRHEEHKTVARRLWGNTTPASEASEESSLISERGPAAPQDNVPVSKLYSTPSLRKPLYIVSFAMLAQQLSGINAVLYYSNDILSKSLPEFGPYISIGITVINVIMTFPPIILIEKVGRKTLLFGSALGALLSLVVVGYGLNNGLSMAASVAIVLFVMSFAVGLGPIPFVLIPEVSPPHAVSSLSSVALSLNWIVNFLVGLAFLPVRNFLSGGDMYKEGRVFYLFTVLLCLATLPLYRLYKG